MMAYTALCIGGPYAGKMMTSQTSSFYAKKLLDPAVSPMPLGETPDMNKKTERVLYDYKALVYGPDGPVVVAFTPTDWNAPMIINELFPAYAQRRDTRALADRALKVIESLVSEVRSMPGIGWKEVSDVRNALEDLVKGEDA